MTDSYIRQIFQVVIAQLCETIGWNSITPSALEVLEDILHKYLTKIARDIQRSAEICNRSSANLEDVKLTLQNMNISVEELREFINYFKDLRPPISVPKFPTKKKSFLTPEFPLINNEINHSNNLLQIFLDDEDF